VQVARVAIFQSVGVTDKSMYVEGVLHVVVNKMNVFLVYAFFLYLMKYVVLLLLLLSKCRYEEKK